MDLDSIVIDNASKTIHYTGGGIEVSMQDLFSFIKEKFVEDLKRVEWPVNNTAVVGVEIHDARLSDESR